MTAFCPNVKGGPIWHPAKKEGSAIHITPSKRRIWEIDSPRLMPKVGAGLRQPMRRALHAAVNHKKTWQ
jgi:hypothetical protein